jgi:hypothetical protein
MHGKTTIKIKINVFIKQFEVSHLLQVSAVPANLCNYTDALSFLRTQN